MGDLFSSGGNSSQATTSQQVGVQGSAGSGATIGLGAGSVNNKINITTADPAIVQAALGTVNDTVNAGADVALESVNSSGQDTIEALHALESENVISAASQNSATIAAETVASNAQQLAYGQPTQGITQPGTASTNGLLILATIIGAIASIAYLLRGKKA